MEEKLKNLINQFSDHSEEYKSSKYDESNTRSDFIDKFFECLGWDVRNDKGYAEDYRDVVREDSIHIEGKPKAPDYSFRIGGVRKFFVEAKKPSINIKKDIGAAYQLRRYAYTAKLPLSILTDFEEFAVYDTRIKPKANDKASVARVFYCRYDEYEKHWDFIKSTFSREAILKGSFDKYVKSNKKKRGTSEVDREFLLQIEGWRKELARNIALRNKNLSIHELNFAVQKIIDRIIFLRIAEDRGMEDYATLRKMTENKDKKYHIYKELVKYFRHADKKYNSGLFDFESDSITPNLTIDHKIFGSIIKDLYYPNSPYEFSVLPIEILGHIYEQFLGRTIRLTPAHHAKIEYKPEVRKAGGVYYTPQYIVDYIVKNTLGEKLKGKTPGQIRELTVLDPACGSGSFLITAYDHLMKYYLSYYSDETRSEKALKDSIIYAVDEETYRLTIDAKRDILTRHIYGVDIDSQAVEVTKLSLLLKLMENERLETTQHLFTRMEMKLLPDLSDNIKCGNSLIGSDFFEGQQIDMFDDELIRKINAFDWDKEFPKIFSRGGFDVVIGNPPYGAKLSKYEKKYMKENYHLNNRDTAALFIELITKVCNLNKSVNSYIIPKPMLYASNWLKTRELLIDNLTTIVDCNKVWKKVKLEQIIFITDYRNKTKSYKSCIRDRELITEFNEIDKRVANKFNVLINAVSDAELRIGEKLYAFEYCINDFVNNSRGGRYQQYIEEKGSKIILGGINISRYHVSYDKIKGYTESDDLDKGTINSNSILVQNIVAHVQNPFPHLKIIAAPANEKLEKNGIILDTINQLTLNEKDIKYSLLAILNSKLISWYIYKFVICQAIRTLHFDNYLTERIPLPKDFNRFEEQFKSYVNNLMDKDMNKEQEKLIDRQVYKLYKLTLEEIEMVEGG